MPIGSAASAPGRAPSRRTSPSGAPASRANTFTVSPSNTEAGSADTHAGREPAGHSMRTASSRGERRRANMRSTAGSTASPGATKSQAPPVASARRRRWLSAGLLPMPTTNTRCPDVFADAMVASMALISPSVTTSTSLGAPPPSAKVEASALSISVPPRSACSAPTQRCAASRVMSVRAHRLRERCSTVEPKRESEKRSPVPSCSTIDCSARRAASMLSPAMEPEQSTSSCTSVVAGPCAGMRGQKLASATVLPGSTLSRASTATDACASWSTTSTKSRSSMPRRASDTCMWSFACRNAMPTGWLGEATRARASSPCSRSAMSKG